MLIINYIIQSVIGSSRRARFWLKHLLGKEPHLDLLMHFLNRVASRHCEGSKATKQSHISYYG